MLIIFWAILWFIYGKHSVFSTSTSTKPGLPWASTIFQYEKHQIRIWKSCLMRKLISYWYPLLILVILQLGGIFTLPITFIIPLTSKQGMLVGPVQGLKISILFLNKAILCSLYAKILIIGKIAHQLVDIDMFICIIQVSILSKIVFLMLQLLDLILFLSSINNSFLESSNHYKHTCHDTFLPSRNFSCSFPSFSPFY